HHAVFETTEQRFRYLRGRSWTWDQNPFVGTHELNGLKIIIMLLSNWDNKDTRDVAQYGSNVGMLEDTQDPRKPTVYYVNDWGESLGSWGRHNMNHDRWHCEAFRQQTADFVKGVRNERVE